MHTQIRKDLLIWLLFAGSVFITSGKFVDTQNAPKFYFVVVFILVLGLFIAIKPKAFAGFSILRNKGLFLGIFAICFMQALLGLAQYAGLLHSSHSRFAVTGSFDNPAGFAAVLSIVYPVGLFLFKNSKTVEKYMVTTGLFIIAISVVLSGSRAGILAILISLLSFLLFQTNTIQLIRENRVYQFPVVLLIFLIIGFSAFLYQYKKDSADGRLLIWNVSCKMVQDKPVLGHGYGSFQAKYMDYQAEYFKKNLNSKFELLADNVKHPFNEFIKVAVEFGLVGMAVISFMIGVVLWKLKRSKNEFRYLIGNGLVSFFVFACFSYPLQYISIWWLLVFYISLIFLPHEINKRITVPTILVRVVTVIICILLLFNTLAQIKDEIKWKAIAVNSLNGRTKDMLPEYEQLYSTRLKRDPFFLYNYGAELNVAKEYFQSNRVLTECAQLFIDYDLQLLVADNYMGLKDYTNAEASLKLASNMIPNRFYPLYQLVKLYEITGQIDKVKSLADVILRKPVKVPSETINAIKREMEVFIAKNGNNGS